MKQYHTVLGIPLSLPLDQLSEQIAGTLGIQPKKRSSYFRAGDYDLFALPTGEAYLQRNYDEDDAAAPYATEDVFPYIFDMWDTTEGAAALVNRQINAALGVICPVLRQAAYDDPLLDIFGSPQ